MTINISKPEFNLREKLSELDRPVGNHGSQLMRSHDIEESFNLIGAGRKNLLINGDFSVNQRGYDNKAFTTGQNGWGFDKWYFHEGTNGSFKISIKSAAPYPPETSKYLELEITSTDTSLASGQYGNISTNIEGYHFQPAMFGTRHARPLTLSFWHKHTIAGLYGGVCRDSNSDLNYVWEYRQSSADAWEKAVIPIKAEFNNAWPGETSASFRLGWSIGNGASHLSSNLLNWFSGSYYHTTTNQVNMYNTNNSKFRLAAVQLEVGNQATPFEYRTYAEELALCERYYERYWQNNNSDGPGGGGGDGYNTIAAGTHNGTNSYFPWRFRTQKRARPSVNYAGKFRVIGGASIANQTPNEFYSPGADGVRIRVGHSGSSGQAYVLEFDGANSSNGYLEASAEI